MVIREYASCDECGTTHTLRIGLGSQPKQSHVFACTECGMDMEVSFALGKGITLGENATQQPWTDNAPVVNLHGDFVFDQETISDPKAFASLQLGPQLIAETMKARARAGIPEDYQGPILPPVTEEWDALRASWSLIRNGKEKLAQKRMEKFVSDVPYPEPPDTLQEWIFLFCGRLTQPFYDEKFEPIFEELKTASEQDGFEDFLVYYDSKLSREHGRRFFQIMRDYLGQFSEFSQVHPSVASGVEIGDDHAVSTVNFDKTQMIYGNIFEAFASNVETLAFLNNLLSGRKFDEFQTMTAAKYATLDKASRFGPFQDTAAFSAICTEADNQLRNGTHHGGAEFDKKSRHIRYRAGKGGQGPEQQLGYAKYLAKCSRLFIQSMVLLKLELLIANRFGVRLPF